MEATLLTERIGAHQTMELTLIARIAPDTTVLDAKLKLASRVSYDPTYAQNPSRCLARFALEGTTDGQLAFKRHCSVRAL